MIVIRRAVPGDLPSVVALFALPVDGNVLDQGPTEPSNLSRDGAHRFYERLGFVASHKGMKLELASR
jgi:hypothetical protein